MNPGPLLFPVVPLRLMQTVCFITGQTHLSGIVPGSPGLSEISVRGSPYYRNREIHSILIFSNRLETGNLCAIYVQLCAMDFAFPSRLSE